MLSPDHAHEVVRDLYQVLLDRTVDDVALGDKVARLAGGQSSLGDVVAEIVASAEYRGRLQATTGVAAGGVRFTNDHSQFGEVWLLVRAMLNEAAISRWVVDIGARGRERSNSFDLLHSFGWRGLLVEANPRLLASIRDEFSGLDVRVVGAAVSDHDGPAMLTIGINDDVSSLSPESAGDWGRTRGTVEVDVVRLPDLLRNHDVPRRFDLLSIDIEGEDIRVLNDLIAHSAHRPEWIIIEASHDFATRSLADVGASTAVQATYGIAAQTTANLLLRRLEGGAARVEAFVSGAVAPVLDAIAAVQRNQGYAPDLRVTGDAAAGERVRAMGRLLAPSAAIGVGKVRVGGDGDGGYVMLDDLNKVGAVFSLGIGGDVSWDEAMAARGARVHQFDHTVQAPPSTQPGLVFHPLRVAARPAVGTVTLATLHRAAGVKRRVRPPRDILKIDIEQDEWDALLAADAPALASYRQIVCEFHWFNAAGSERWSETALAVLGRLNEQFQCVHVHANNCAPFSLIGGVPFPAVLEATFANRSVYAFEPETSLFPTSFDQPNDPSRPDHFLGRFAF